MNEIKGQFSALNSRAHFLDCFLKHVSQTGELLPAEMILVMPVLCGNLENMGLFSCRDRK